MLQGERGFSRKGPQPGAGQLLLQRAASEGQRQRRRRRGKPRGGHRQRLARPRMVQPGILDPDAHGLGLDRRQPRRRLGADGLPASAARTARRCGRTPTLRDAAGQRDAVRAGAGRLRAAPRLALAAHQCQLSGGRSTSAPATRAGSSRRCRTTRNSTRAARPARSTGKARSTVSRDGQAAGRGYLELTGYLAAHETLTTLDTLNNLNALNNYSLPHAFACSTCRPHFGDRGHADEAGRHPTQVRAGHAGAACCPSWRPYRAPVHPGRHRAAGRRRRHAGDPVRLQADDRPGLRSGAGAQGARHVNLSFLALFGVACVLAVATAARFYMVSWLGERVTADIRSAVYRHVVDQSPRVLRDHADRRSAVAPDHRHHADPGRGRHQHLDGAAQCAAVRRRPGDAVRHQRQAVVHHPRPAGAGGRCRSCCSAAACASSRAIRRTASPTPRRWPAKSSTPCRPCRPSPTRRIEARRFGALGRRRVQHRACAASARARC